MSVFTPRPHPTGPSAVYLRTLCFLFHGDDVLLMFRERPPDAGFWNALGGKIELGEDPLEAAAREVREEAGVRPTLRFRGVATAVVRATGEHWAIFLFAAHLNDRAVVESSEGPLRWVTPAELPGLPVLADVPLLLPSMRDRSGPPIVAKFTYAAADSGTLEDVQIR
jgi:8-oxo-dGTP diphosphatase